MERLRFRSTSVTDLMAELHERDLLAPSERPTRPPIRPTRRTVFGLSLRRRHRRDEIP